MKVPYFDLKRQYKNIGNEIETNILKSLRSTQYSLGPEVIKFEKNMQVSFLQIIVLVSIQVQAPSSSFIGLWYWCWR